MYNAAIVACAVYNVHRSDEKTPVLTPEEMLGETKRKRVQSAEDMKAFATLINKAVGGIDTRKAK